MGERGITVNNVQPGPIDTELNAASSEWAVPQIANTALKRYGKVDEVAALVAFVASPESSYIAGAASPSRRHQRLIIPRPHPQPSRPFQTLAPRGRG